MTWLAIAAGALLPLSIFLDEAVLWFGRNALDLIHSEEEQESAEEFARAARRARLVSRLIVAVSFSILGALAVRSPSIYPMMTLMVAGIAWTVTTGALAGVYWRSPLGLAGRAVFRPSRWLGEFLRWIVLTWGRLPGPDSPMTSVERVQEAEQELHWLLGLDEEDEQGEMLANLQEFGESLAEDVMVPREEVAAIPAKAGIKEIVEVVKRERHSRYPVYEESLDTVVGVLHVFDLLDIPPDVNAASLSRQPFFTNDTKSVGALLRELQVTYNQMAVVVDEYGGTAGIVTVEDLLEELVGEIEDEHDEEETPLRRVEPGVYWVEASIRLDEVNEALELNLPEGEYDTLAGLVLDRLERVPRQGERIREDGVVLEVVAAEPHRIQALRVIILEPAARRDEL